MNRMTKITRQLLSAEGQEPLQLIAQLAQQIADADVVTVVLPTIDGDRLIPSDNAVVSRE